MWWVAALVACSGGEPVDPIAAAQLQLDAGDVDEAASALDTLCAAGSVEACALRVGVPAGPEEAVHLAAERACEASVAAACVARSREPGDRWDQAACEAGDGPACQRAASTAEGRMKGRWAGQACHLGVMEACLPAAVAAWREADAGRAVALASVVCRARDADTACLVAEGWRRSEGAVQRCDEGDAVACLDACEAGLGCVDEGLKSACEAGAGRACRLAALQGASEAEHLLWRGCDEVDDVDPWACLLLADRVEAGAPLPPAARGGVAWLRTQACDLQLDYGCATHQGW